MPLPTKQKELLESQGIDVDRLGDPQYVLAQKILRGGVEGATTTVLEALLALDAARETGATVAGVELTGLDVCVLLAVFER